MLKIHIYPCVDDVLYAPVYAAIHCLRNRPGVTGHDPIRQKDGTVEFPCTQPVDGTSRKGSPDEALSVFLHPSCGGDKEVLAALHGKQNTAHEIHLGVGDPATALSENNNSAFPHVLLSTFVTRVALWAVCRTKGFEAETKERERMSRELINRAKRADLELFYKSGCFHPLRLGYSAKGETTKAVVEMFVEKGFEAVVPEHHRGSLGKEEIRGIVNQRYEIAITYAPWLLPLVVREERADPDEFSRAPVFHGVPYPFSGVYGRFENEDELRTSAPLVNTFMRQIIAGLTLLYRYKRTSVELLNSLAVDMRHYGMDVSESTDNRRRMLNEAFRRLILSDCFSDSLDTPLFSWDMRVEPRSTTHRQLLGAALATAKLRSTANVVGERSFITEELQQTLEKVVQRVGMESFGRMV